jgi:hypothetical protein
MGVHQRSIKQLARSLARMCGVLVAIVVRLAGVEPSQICSMCVPPESSRRVSRRDMQSSLHASGWGRDVCPCSMPSKCRGLGLGWTFGSDVATHETGRLNIQPEWQGRISSISKRLKLRYSGWEYFNIQCQASIQTSKRYHMDMWRNQMALKSFSNNFEGSQIPLWPSWNNTNNGIIQIIIKS